MKWDVGDMRYDYDYHRFCNVARTVLRCRAPEVGASQIAYHGLQAMTMRAARRHSSVAMFRSKRRSRVEAAAKLRWRASWFVKRTKNAYVSGCW